MIPEEIVNSMGLVPTTKVIGESFIQNETIYDWPGLIDNAYTFIMGCDETGKPLTKKEALVYCSGFTDEVPPQKWWVSMKIAHEMLNDVAKPHVKLMLQKYIERVINKIRRPTVKGVC